MYWGRTDWALCLINGSSPRVRFPPNEWMTEDELLFGLFPLFLFMRFFVAG